MSNSNQILAMLRSRADGDEEQFFSIALQIAAAEARQGHRLIAEQIREAVNSARSLTNTRSRQPLQLTRQPSDLEGILHAKTTQLTLRDVILSPDIRSQLEDVVRQQRRRDWLREHGKTPSRRLLFVGAPGVGKTMTAESLAGELKMPLFVIRLEGLITRYLGETTAKLRLVFDDTNKRRGVYLFDEFDAVGGKRNATNDVAEMRRVLNSFLQYMEEANVTDSIIVGATNHAELLDRALLRRFDTVIKFGLPTSADIKAIIVSNLGRIKHSKVNWKDIYSNSKGLSQAEISRAAEDAAKTAILNERNVLTTDDLVARLNERRRMHEAFIGN